MFNSFTKGVHSYFAYRHKLIEIYNNDKRAQTGRYYILNAVCLTNKLV